MTQTEINQEKTSSFSLSDCLHRYKANLWKTKQGNKQGNVLRRRLIGGTKKKNTFTKSRKVRDNPQQIN